MPKFLNPEFLGAKELFEEDSLGLYWHVETVHWGQHGPENCRSSATRHLFPSTIPQNLFLFQKSNPLPLDCVSHRARHDDFYIRGAFHTHKQVFDVQLGLIYRHGLLNFQTKRRY
jgi:hypothetical protein